MGNICRSPTAEAVFRAHVERVAPDFAVEADSAGTHDYHIGSEPDERAIRVAASHGIEMSHLRARQLSDDDFTRFDRILVMDQQNLQAVQRRAPSGSHARVQLLLDYAPQQSLREVPDPYYGSASDFERVFELTRQASAGLLRSLQEEARQRSVTPAGPGQGYGK